MNINIIDYSNNLSFIETLSIFPSFKYLINFKLLFDNIGKANTVLKSSKYNINLPTESEVNRLLKAEKNNDTQTLLSLLMKFIIKQSKTSYNSVLKDGYHTVIKLNNNSSCYIRTILFEENIKKLLNNEKITEISEIYNIYKKNYEYINDNYIFSGSILDDDNSDIIFNELLDVNKCILDNILIDSHVQLFNMSNDNFLLIDKTKYLNENKDNTNINDDELYDLGIEKRIEIFEKIIYNLKKTNNPEAYLDKILSELKTVYEYNLLSDMDDKCENYKNKINIINNLLFNKLSPLVSIALILQPYSPCSLEYMLFNISNLFEISNKTKIKDDNIKDLKKKEIINAQTIIQKITNIIINNNNNNNNNIDNIIKEYEKFLYNDQKLSYKIVWLVICSYYLENIINDANSNYYDINYNNFISYIKLFGIKQYNKGDFYKIRIQWIINLFNEDTNSSLTLPNLYKYCSWLIMNEDKNNFIMDIYLNNSDSDNSCD